MSGVCTYVPVCVCVCLRWVEEGKIIPPPFPFSFSLQLRGGLDYQNYSFWSREIGGKGRKREREREREREEEREREREKERG